jgi:SH3 domain protein
MARYNVITRFLPLYVGLSLVTAQSLYAEEEAVSAPAATSTSNSSESASHANTSTSGGSAGSSSSANAQKKIDVKGITPTKNWVSDRVETPIRSCTTDKCRIVKSIHPGNEITVTGYTPDGWAYVSVGDVKGFIPKRYLQDTPLLVIGNDAKSGEVNGVSLQNTKSEVDALMKRAETAEGETGSLRKENYELKQELDYIKGLSNQTLQVNEENRRLKTETEMLRQRNEILEQEARDGEGRDQRAWVIVGAGIILVGWLLGRFARMPRRKGWNQV